MSDPGYLDSVLLDGAGKASEIADATLNNVYQAMGFLRRQHMFHHAEHITRTMGSIFVELHNASLLALVDISTSLIQMSTFVLLIILFDYLSEDNVQIPSLDEVMVIIRSYIGDYGYSEEFKQQSKRFHVNPPLRTSAAWLMTRAIL